MQLARSIYPLNRGIKLVGEGEVKYSSPYSLGFNSHQPDIEHALACHNTCTVNMVIFTERKFRENVGKTFHAGVIFKILLNYILNEVIWVLFSAGEIFVKKTGS